MIALECAVHALPHFVFGRAPVASPKAPAHTPSFKASTAYLNK